MTTSLLLTFFRTAQDSSDPVESSDDAAAGIASADAEAGIGLSVAESFDWVGPIFEHTPHWAWAWLAVAIFLGLAAGKIVQAVMRGAGDRLIKRGWELRGTIFQDAATPLSLALFTLGLQLGLAFIHTDPIYAFVGRTLQLLYTIALGWFIFNLVDLVELGLRRLTRADSNKLAGQLVPLIRKALRIFIAVVFVLFIAQNIFEQNITAWLAGLGIAGLAVSLAGQDSIKNLFGSITVLLDKPFAIGDRITFGDVDGFVEEIGFRSTKLRTFTGHVITIPNMKFIDGTVENITARPFIRRLLNVTITYDTPPEKINQAVQIIKDLLSEEEFSEPFNMEERPPRVFFNDFNADSLNISVSYWYFLKPESKPGAGDARDWWTYQNHGERFNHRLFRAYADAGIDFAFPTQTLYLAGDPDRQLAVRVLREDAQPN